MNSSFDRERVLASRKAAEQRQIELVQCNKRLTNEEKSKQIAVIQAEYNELNARLFATKEAKKARVDDIRADIAAKKRSQRKENERFFSNVFRNSAFFNNTQTLLNDLFPCAQLEFSEYVYNNRLGELFFFTMPDFAPDYVVAVVNSINRLADFDYAPLLFKPIPFSDMSRIQIKSEQIKQEIYDQFDLIYHESNITKLSCYNPQIFKREDSPFGVLKASDYENNDCSIKSPEDDMNIYSHKGEHFKLDDFMPEKKITTEDTQEQSIEKGIGAFNRIPIHHIIRGGGFDRRKKRKSKKEQYSNRKKINNPESTENGVNRNNDISDESSDSDQAPKKKRPHSIDMHTLNGNLINPESDCTIENDIEKLTVNNTTPKNVQKNTKGRPSINLRGSAKASVEAKKRKNVASLSSNSNISPNSSVPVNENKSQNEIPTDSTQPHIFDTPRGRSRIKEKPQNKESKSNPPEIAPLDNSSQNSEAANAVLPEKRKRGRPAKSVSVEKPKNKQSEPRRRSSRVEARDKDLLEKRQKGIQEQIRDWKDSLPSTEALLLEFTAMYLARHPQPTAVFKELNKITCACHRQYEDKFKYYCASIKANHEVPYYDSGDFDWLCDECKAKLLKSEKDAQKEHKWGKCCAYGDVNTTLMKEEFAELTTKAPENLQNILYREKSERENFFNNTLPLNNAHSFGSIECGKAPQTSKSKNVCKVNGEISFRISDLYAPDSKTPLFGQMYVIDPEIAIQYREEHLQKEPYNVKIKESILELVDNIIRTNHPFAQIYKRTDRLYKDEIQRRELEGEPDLPKFRLILLTNRELQEAVIKNHPGIKLIHSSEKRTNESISKQIACVWMDEDGAPPEFSGVWLDGASGNFREIEGYKPNPNIEPACFSLLFPKGTQGYRFGLKKNPRNKTQNLKRGDSKIEEQFMQSTLSSVDTLDEPPCIVDPASEVRDFVEKEINAHREEIFGKEEADKEETNDQQPNIEKKKQKGKKEENISMRQFWRYRMFYRKEQIDRDKDHTFHWLWTMRKLAEYFIITVENRIEQNEMKWAKLNQKNLREILAKDLVDALAKGVPENGTLGKIYMTPSSFMGGRKYYQKCYADLMKIVQACGNPTWFLTFTGNPCWPEITRNLMEGQEYKHKADIVCRYFVDKVTEFVKDITQRHVLGRVKAWTFSVEHQQGGMPHIHFLVILEKMDDLRTPDFVNQYICSRIPQLPSPDDISPQAMQQRRLWQLVTRLNLHDCVSGRACRVLKFNKSGEPYEYCTKGFKKPYSETTVLSEVKYTSYTRLPPQDIEELDLIDEYFNPSNDPENPVQYKRLSPAQPEDEFDYTKNGCCFFKKRHNEKHEVCLTDQDVVPYNPFLTLKYGTHINIEYVFGQQSCKYLFKYILKGHETAYVKVSQQKDGSNVFDYDEIAATFRARFMTAFEAYLRLIGYPVVHSDYTVVTMPIYLPGEERCIFEEGQEENAERGLGQENKLTGYFELNSRNDEDGELARKTRYDEIEIYFTWDEGSKRYKRRQKSAGKLLTRVWTVHPRNSELYACRLLLMNRLGATSHDDLKKICVEGEEIVLKTFIEAAKYHGLLDSDSFWESVMEDAAIEISNTNRLIRHFAQLVFYYPPNEPKKMFDTFLDKMFPQPLNAQDPDFSKRIRKQSVLLKIEYYLRRLGSDCKRAGLYEPEEYDEELMDKEMEEEEMINLLGGDYDAKKKVTWQAFTDGRIKKMKNNEPQLRAFKTILQAVRQENPKQKLFFLEGPGGCGKTFLYNTLISQLKQDNMGIVACASTGIAALLLLNGKTAHRTFRIPENVNRTTPPKFSYEKDDSKKLREARVIIIDEVSMLHRDVLHFIDRTLQDLQPRDERKQPFGGKIVVIGGDFKQLLPVVEGQPMFASIAASIKYEPVFKKFDTLRMRKNMRAEPQETKFCEWLCDVGSGKKNIKGTSEIELPSTNIAKSSNELIDFCFEDLFNATNPLSKSEILGDAAILAPRNDIVASINEKALDKLNGEKETFTSIDTPLNADNDPTSVYLADNNIEAIHDALPSGLPPHILELKVGTPVMLIRNIDVDRGLANGTRMQILRFSKNKHHLICRILTGPNKGRIEFIHRINIEYGTQRRAPLKFRRLQFPVRVCFAMTVNKAQGQSLKRVGLNLERQQCFSHGQVYVAMSRVSKMSGIRVYSPTSSAPNRILNIVYKPILEEIDLDKPVSMKDHEKLIQKDITDFMIPPQKSPNRTQLDVCDSMADESMEVDIEPSNSSTTINTVQINDDAMDCEIVEEIPRPSANASTKKHVPRTPRNRRRAYIRDVRGDGNCFFRAICLSGYGDERHAAMRSNMCDFLIENWQINSNVAWALGCTEIHWEGVDALPSPSADLYVATKRTPAEHAGQTWKYAGCGEFLLCSMMLQRPIICVGPASTTNPQLMATVYQPHDTPEHCFYHRQRIPIIDDDLDALFNMPDVPNPIVVNHVNDNHFQAIIYPQQQ